ncbi:MAG TPA: hypothetical protein VNO55_15950 [Polyangia bacterium]|nr:hypothetical protein [Polyangia bacterium]
MTVDAADLLAQGAVEAASPSDGEPGGGATGAPASATTGGAQRALLRFVAQFLLPLVRGGALHVGRPLGPKFVARLAATLAQRSSSTALVLAAPAPSGRDVDVATALSTGRHAAAVRLLPGARVPALDEATLRLGAALHNLLSLTHPGIEGRGAEGRQARIADAAEALASLGPPRSAAEAVDRHSLLGRLPDIGRSDRVVHFWLGRRSFVGRLPPRRVTALPRLRQVRIDTIHRGWLREIGMPACARPAFLALSAASPLGETEDLFRLEPPLAWSRILPVLRFPALARLVAGRIVEQGVDRAGDVLADALFRFASGHDPNSLNESIPGGEAVAFAIRFLAHTVWLDLLFSAGSAAAPSSSSTVSDGAAGLDLAVILVAAQRISSALVWPPDVAPDSDLGRRFIDRMTAMASKVRVRRSSRLDAAVGVATLAAQSLA